MSTNFSLQPKLSPLIQADVLLTDLQKIVRAYNRPAPWDVVAPMLLNEIAVKLDDVRQLLHALAELDATAHQHADGCSWGRGRSPERKDT